MSLGGYIALKICQDYPTRISGGIHSQSGAFQVDKSVVSQEKLGNYPAGERIYLDWGSYEQDLTDINERAAKSMTALGRPFGSSTTHEGHTWTAWRNRFASGLQYLLARRRG